MKPAAFTYLQPDTVEEALEALQQYGGDARVLAADGGDIWETYRRYSKLRWFPKPNWVKQTPDRLPQQDWVEERRPR